MCLTDPEKIGDCILVCQSCGRDTDHLVRRGSKWICVLCDEPDDLDLDEFEEHRRRYIAEANEY